jgi:hypothetical protein
MGCACKRRATARSDNPSASRPWACSTSTWCRRGRPSRRPCAFARRRPATTRSRMRSRSNSAMAASTWNRSRPLGVVVSIAWSSTTKSTPRSLEVRRQRHQVPRRARQTVQADAHDAVHLPGPHSGEQRVKRRPTILGARDAVVDKLRRLPTPGRRECAQGHELILGRLLARRDARVEGRPEWSGRRGAWPPRGRCVGSAGCPGPHRAASAETGGPGGDGACKRTPAAAALGAEVVGRDPHLDTARAHPQA